VFFSHATKCLWRDFRFLKPKDLVTQWQLLFDFGDVILSLLTPRRVLSMLMKFKNLIAVVYPTREEMVNMQKLVPEKLFFTLPSGGADLPQFYSSNPSYLTNADNFLQSDSIILFFGRSRLTRGVDVLIDAFSMVRQRIKNCKLWLFLLDDKDKEKIINKIRKSKEQENIVLSVKHQVKIQTFLELTHVVVLPFRWGRSMPSHPLTVLEAMTVGKVVVTSRVGAITKIIKDGENGLLVDDPRNPTEIAEKILKALNDPELRAKIGANAKKTVEQFFQWKDLASSFYEIHLNAHLNLEETTFKSSHQQTESENFVAI
jgi:glycosyltransferase involved in cell wall biosynthesis